MFKKFRERFRAMEFKQKLCVYVLTGWTLFICAITALFIFVSNTIPLVDIINATIIIPIIMIGAYTGQASVENVQKIIKSKAESLLKLQSDTSTEKTSENI